MGSLYGGFFRRLCAAMVDQLILLGIYFLYLLAVLVSGFFAINVGEWSAEPEGFLIRGGLIIFLFHLWCFITWFGYYTYFHGATGQTPGKKLFSLKVVDPMGGRIRPSIAFLRTAGYLLSASIFFLGFLWVLVDKKRRSWHDLIAGTVVVREREKHLDKGRDIY